MLETPEHKRSLENLLLSGDSTINAALKRMNEINRKLLMVIDGSAFLGLFSIGDVQRAILAGTALTDQVGKHLRKDYLVARAGDSPESIRATMIRDRVEYMPVLDQTNQLDHVVFWEDLFSEKRQPEKTVDVPVVIMAGGMGTRLKPLTNVIPKALVPVHDKPIIEDIVNRFADQGARTFLVSINYKGKMIRDYFDEVAGKIYSMDYFTEDTPLGTAGSLKLVEDRLSGTFIVSNCDIIVDHDYSDILDFHRKNGFAMTVVSALKTITIPYGVLTTGPGGVLLDIDEKPDLSYQVNTGLYVLESRLLTGIPAGKVFHITHLIEALRTNGEKIGVYPINERSWMDMGEWGELNRMGRLLIGEDKR